MKIKGDEERFFVFFSKYGRSMVWYGRRNECYTSVM